MKLPQMMILAATAALTLTSVNQAQAGESWSLRRLLGLEAREHAERPEKPQKPERPERPEKPEKPERPGHR